VSYACILGDSTKNLGKLLVPQNKSTKHYVKGIGMVDLPLRRYIGKWDVYYSLLAKYT